MWTSYWSSFQLSSWFRSGFTSCFWFSVWFSCWLSSWFTFWFSSRFSSWSSSWYSLQFSSLFSYWFKSKWSSNPLVIVFRTNAFVVNIVFYVLVKHKFISFNKQKSVFFLRCSFRGQAEIFFLSLHFTLLLLRFVFDVVFQDFSTFRFFVFGESVSADVSRLTLERAGRFCR